MPRSGKRSHPGVRATKGSGCSPYRRTERTGVCEDEPAGPLIGCIPRGGRLRAEKRAEEDVGLYERLPAPYRARRARWTLPGCDTRPWNGSGCWGACVCKLRAPEMDGRHLRQTRGMEKGGPLFSLSFGWGTPHRASVSGLCGERSRSGASEPARKRAGKGYVACGDEVKQEKDKFPGARLEI